jgi:outer membrane protein OmpA-like peptidoglycan-associated protein
MIEFNFSRRRRPMVAALSVAAALAGALLWAGGPVAAEDAANPNVIVDDSALDGAAGGAAAGEVLPAPARQPVSRLVPAGQSAIEAATPPETTSETTYPAVPTTPIESTSLEGSGEPGEAAATAPAAGAAAEGDASPSSPTTTAETTAPTEGSAPPEATPAANPQTAEGTPPAAEAAPEQTAARPPIDGMVRLTFEPESHTLSDAAKAELTPLIEKLKADYVLRLQILAYAGGDDDASTHARGVSLARALAMRDYLTTEGITTERMDIKALGNAAQEEPADRVDLVPLSE